MTQYLYDRSGAALADDAELERVTAYMGGFMSDAERREFERDFVRDEEFAHRVAPFLKIFYSRAPLANADAARARIQARRERRQREASAARTVEFTPPAAIDAMVVDITPRLAERRRTRIQIQRFLGVVAAAALAVVMLRPGHQQQAVHPTVMSENFDPRPDARPPILATPVATPVPKPNRKRVRQIAVLTPKAVEPPLWAVATDSIDVSLPAPQFALPKLSAAVDPDGRTITVAASPLDTAYQNAQERLRELTDRLRKAATDAAARRRGWMHVPELIGRVFGRPRAGAKPPSRLR